MASHRKRTKTRLAHSVPAPEVRAEPSQDQSWDARITALKREPAVGWAMIAAMAASLAMLAGWVAVFVAPGGNIRLNPMFWLLAAPLLPWFWALQSFAAWAIKTIWLALVLAPCLALLAWLVAPMVQQGAGPEGGSTSLATPAAMLVILGLTVAASCAGAVALRRSSLPGGTRPATYLAPGTPLPGVRPLSPEARWMLMLGSVTFSAALVNGLFFAIVAALDPVGSAVWPPAMVALLLLTLGTFMFRGAFRLARRRPGAAHDLRRGWLLGMGFAAAARCRPCGPGRR